MWPPDFPNVPFKWRARQDILRVRRVQNNRKMSETIRRGVVLEPSHLHRPLSPKTLKYQCLSKFKPSSMSSTSMTTRLHIFQTLDLGVSGQCQSFVTLRRQLCQCPLEWMIYPTGLTGWRRLSASQQTSLSSMESITRMWPHLTDSGVLIELSRCSGGGLYLDRGLMHIPIKKQCRGEQWQNCATGAASFD